MNQHLDFKIIYDGPALQSHSMEVRDLAPALLAVGSLFDEVNRLLNGDKTQIKLQVTALGAGSFEVFLNLYQSLAEQVSNFLTGEFVTSVLNLKELLFAPGIGLFWLIKKMKGCRPYKVTDLKNGLVRVEFEGDTIDVPVPLLRLYQDANIRRAIEEVLKPLCRDGIDSFKVKEKEVVIASVTKDQLTYFRVPKLEDEKIVSSESEAAYSIVSLAFKDDNKWRLSDGGATINVTIHDENFKKKVEQNEISFAKGDILRCKIKTIQWRTTEGLRTEHEVLEVREHIPAARQQLLF